LNASCGHAHTHAHTRANIVCGVGVCAHAGAQHSAMLAAVPCCSCGARARHQHAHTREPHSTRSH
jgi:hypothetical protein